MPARSYPQGSIPTRPFNTPVVNTTAPIVNATVDKFMNTAPAEVTAGKTMTPEEAEMELDQEIPPSWSEPKIFTGTSLS